ncbi:hypothetical protein GCM10010400_77920 [Streptomyces aculeolatus]
MDNPDVKHLAADMQDGQLVISERSAEKADDSTKDSKAEPSKNDDEKADK